MYGTLLGSILFYEKLAIQFHELEYVTTPYNACTFNKMVNGKHISVQFFIDDFHISCENMSTIDGLIKDLNNKFKTNFQKLTVTKRKIHDSLGININYSNKDYVKFTMYNFLENILDEGCLDMNGRLKMAGKQQTVKCRYNINKVEYLWSGLFSLHGSQLTFCSKKGTTQYPSGNSFPIYLDKSTNATGLH